MKNLWVVKNWYLFNKFWSHFTTKKLYVLCFTLLKLLVIYFFAFLLPLNSVLQKYIAIMFKYFSANIYWKTQNKKSLVEMIWFYIVPSVPLYRHFDWHVYEKTKYKYYIFIAKYCICHISNQKTMSNHLYWCELNYLSEFYMQRYYFYNVVIKN